MIFNFLTSIAKFKFLKHSRSPIIDQIVLLSQTLKLQLTLLKIVQPNCFYVQGS